MPILKNSEDLNALNKAKRVVFNNLRRRFKGAEHAVDNGTTANVASMYEDFKKRLVAFRALIFEIQATFALTVGNYEADANDGNSSVASSVSGNTQYSTVVTPTAVIEGRKPSNIADRFVGASSKIIVAIDDIMSFTNRILKNTLNYFSPQQVAELAEVYTEIEGQLTTFAEEMEELQNEDARAYYAFDDVSMRWLPKTQAYFTKLGDMFDAYNKGVGANPSGEPFHLDEGSVGSGGSFRVEMGGRAYIPHRYL